MKFRVDRDVLADAVAWTARALPVRPSSPVLSGLLIEAGPTDDAGESGTGLRLSTFDYETSARATLAADVARRGPSNKKAPSRWRSVSGPKRAFAVQICALRPSISDASLNSPTHSRHLDREYLRFPSDRASLPQHVAESHCRQQPEQLADPETAGYLIHSLPVPKQHQELL